MLQNATPLRKYNKHVSCTAPAAENASLQILFKCPTPAIVFGNATKPPRFAHFWQGPQSLAPATRNDIWMSKTWREHVVLLTCSTAQLLKVLRSWRFLYILTWKCARRALFRHCNFQKWSERAFCTFWLGNVLCATTACNFSSLICAAGSAPAALASLLFDPPEPQIMGKTQCFATFPPFRAPGSSFVWGFLFSDLLSSALLLHLCF